MFETAAACALASSALVAPAVQEEAAVLLTPGEQDVPRPVPGSPGLAGDPRPDITRYLMVRGAASPSPAPDGEAIAFSTSITGKSQLWIVAAGGGWPRQLTFGEAVTFHAFSPDGRWIAYGVDRGGDEREGFYLIRPDGSQERELLAPSAAFRVFGGFSPDGTRIAYATTERNGRDYDIHVLDLETGADTEVFRGTFGFQVASWRPDGGALVLTETRGEDANDVHLLDLATGAHAVLFRPDEPASHLGFAWSPDGSGFWFATNDGREFAALAWFDAATRTTRVVESPPHDVEDVTLTRDGRYLLWTTNEDGASRLHVRELETGADLAPPAFEGLDDPQGVFEIRVAARGANVAFAFTGPAVPGDVWTWSPDRRGEERLARRATHSTLAGLDARLMVHPEHHDFAARDGLQLHGLLYLPANAPESSGALPPGQRSPLLLRVHGGPTAQARPAFNAVTQYLVRRGFAVFELNYRGSTGYGKAFARADDRRRRAAVVNDLADALDHLAGDRRVDASRAAIMGGSYGGYLVNAALCLLPDRFRAGVSIVGVSDWVTALEGASPELKASDRLEYGDIDDPEDREFFRSISPITHVAKLRAPLMVMHGANDPRDPVAESDRFVRAIREQGGEVEYLRFPDEGHGLRTLENRVIFYRRVATFLEHRLRPETLER